MFGAHVTTQNIRGEKKQTRWQGYGSWAGCFAGLSYETVAHLEDDHTAIATIALASGARTRGVANKSQLAQRAFLFGEFAQRLTDGAFIAWDEPEVNTPLATVTGMTWGHRNSGVNTIIPNAHNVHFIPHRHQDLIVTAFRMSKQAHQYGIENWVTPDDYEAYTIMKSLRSGDGWAYSDSGVVFGTPYASRVLDFVGEKYDGDFDEMYDDDICDQFSGDDFTKLTLDGLSDMLTRTTEEFRDYCRQGMCDIIGGYTKDVELGSDELRAMRPDDPIGLAAPMRFTKSGGRMLKDIGDRELVGLIQEILRG